MTINVSPKDELDSCLSYPQNLPLSPIEVCAQRYSERLSLARKRLFVDNDDNQVEILEFGHNRDEIKNVKYGRINSITQLKTCFQRGYFSYVLCVAVVP